MKISIPNIAVPEVEYTFSCLLDEFLGLNYEIEIQEGSPDFVISNSDKSIVIKNYFFKNKDPKSWYQLAQIPSKVAFDFLIFDKKKYPIHSLFGKPTLEKKGDNFILNADIIAATFFMLSRWEEAIKPQRDANQRFSAKDSLAFQHHFLQKPIVNEYVEILWILLKKIGITQPIKLRNFRMIPTHDVDIPYLFPTKLRGLKSVARHLISKDTFGDGMFYLKSFLKGKDAYDTHDLFLEGAEKIGEEAHFFFMSGGKNKFDPRPQITHPKVKALIEKVKNRGHQIGFHPSYDTFENPELFSEEKEKLEKITEQKVSTGRQHYLRFEVPSTWKIWENEKMNWDSTMGYSDAIGFRCGVCFPFPVFDIFDRKKLNLYEKPLLLMEVTLSLYLKLTLAEAQSKVNDLINEVKKYNGEFVFLWHNSSIHLRSFSKYNPILFDFYKID